MWNRWEHTARDERMSDQTELLARIWGARGSMPCGGADYARYGGDTSCVELRVRETSLILDAGSGLRVLGDRLMAEALDRGTAVDVDILLSHTHYDHIMGLTAFAPFFDPRSRVRVWLAREPGGLAARDTFERIFAHPFFPLTLAQLRATITFHDFEQGATLAFPHDVTITTHALNHPGGATAFRATRAGRSVCYVTDLEHQPGTLDTPLVEFVRDADAMFYDATFTDADYPAHRGWGHSTWEEGLRVSAAAGVQRFLAFHHNPAYDDARLAAIEQAIQAQNPAALVARQGTALTV